LRGKLPNDEGVHTASSGPEPNVLARFHELIRMPRKTKKAKSRKQQDSELLSELAVILLVEDREDDILLIRRAFKKIDFRNPLQAVRNGEEAVAYLKGEGQFSNRDEHPLPSLILLDLKMPRMDGFEFLTWIKKQPELRHLPVVVLTSSSELRDVNIAYALGASSFLVKPNDFEKYIELNHALHQIWLVYGRSPEASRAPRTNLREE